MELDLTKILVREVLGVNAHPMRSGHYALRAKRRFSDCFVYVCDGTALYTFEHSTFSVSKGDVFYLAYQSRYDIDVAPNYEVAYVDCMLDAPEGARYESVRFHVEDSAEVERMLLRLERKWVPQSPGCCLMAMSTLYALFSILVQQRAMGYLSSDNRAKMRQARDTIVRGCSDKDFSCADLGASLGLSEVHFRRLFSQLYGVTPNQYLTALRIRFAKAMLMRSATSVSDIAEMSGYHSVYYFCRAFKRETGVTPTEYRKAAF